MVDVSGSWHNSVRRESGRGATATPLAAARTDAAGRGRGRAMDVTRPSANVDDVTVVVSADVEVAPT